MMVVGNFWFICCVRTNTTFVGQLFVVGWVLSFAERSCDFVLKVSVKLSLIDIDKNING